MISICAYHLFRVPAWAGTSCVRLCWIIFKKCTLGHRVAALPFTLMYGMCQNTNRTVVGFNEQKSEENLVYICLYRLFSPSLSCYYYCYHCDGFVYPAGQFPKKCIVYHLSLRSNLS
jgi:hypothetical protein